MSTLDRTALKNKIDAQITDNGNNEITGAIVRAILNDIADSYSNLVDELTSVGLKEYDLNTIYNTGTAVMYDGGIYQASADGNTGVFNASNWVLITQIESPSNYDFVPYESATTYNEEDRVLFQSKFFICNVDGTIAIPPADASPNWTEVSASTGTFGANWEIGYYLNSTVVTYDNKMYYLAEATPPSFNSTDIVAEIGLGNWVLFNNHNELTNTVVKSLYESNPDTNAFTDAYKLILDTLALPVPASQVEVDAGTDNTKFVTPLTLENKPSAGGGGETFAETLAIDNKTEQNDIVISNDAVAFANKGHKVIFQKYNNNYDDIVIYNDNQTDASLMVENTNNDVADGIYFSLKNSSLNKMGFTFGSSINNVGLFYGSVSMALNSGDKQISINTSNNQPISLNSGNGIIELNGPVNCDYNQPFHFGIRMYASGTQKYIKFGTGNTLNAGGNAYNVTLPNKGGVDQTLAFLSDIPAPVVLPNNIGSYEQLNNILSIVLPLGLSIMTILVIPSDGNYIVEYSLEIEHQDDVSITFDMLETYDLGGSGTDGNNNQVYIAPQIGGGAGGLQSRPVAKKSTIRPFLANDTIDLRANVVTGTPTIRRLIAHLIKVN
jgi:hypothetical protein